MVHADFRSFVAAATAKDSQPNGVEPYAYQQEIADKGYPDLIEVPTGAGKTLGATLPWLWRRLAHSDPHVRAATPRRLVLTLPTRALTDQTEQAVRGWVTSLGLESEVKVHVLMGGRIDRGAANEWRANLHRPTIVIATIDMLVSRALLRGYGMYRPSYPIDFALVTNGAHIVVDEIQLADQATTTLRQLAAFQKRYGTAEPSGLTVMSATVDEALLDTVDNPFTRQAATVVTLGKADIEGPLSKRLEATRTIRRLPEHSTSKEFAQAIVDRHIPGSLTLVVVNTVDTAVDVFQQVQRIASGATPALLIHSRFRGFERRAHMDRLTDFSDPLGDGGIVITTQAIEAGVDIDARTLITEVAPWYSIVQRAGRCNRAGLRDSGIATIWWTPPKKPEPYDGCDLAGAADVLSSLEGEPVTSRTLLDAGAGLPKPDRVLRVLRRRDLEQLFDTTPDLSGSDLDIRPFIRADLDLDLHVAWVPDDWSHDDRRFTLPPEPLRCPVSVNKIRLLTQRDDVTAWVFSSSEDRLVSTKGRWLKPQDVVLVSASSGGYDSVLGFLPSSRRRVDTDPACSTESSAELDTSDLPEGGSAAQEPGSGNPGGSWLGLAQHLEDAATQAQGLLAELDPVHLDPPTRLAVTAASGLHDCGKAHEDWQAALLAANPNSPPGQCAGAGSGSDDEASGPWAKSPGRGRLLIKRSGTTTGRPEREGFRHELVSVVMLSTSQAGDLLNHLGVPSELQPLVRYLVAAHHGHIRLTARDPRSDGRDGRGLYGCFDGDRTPPLRIRSHDLPPATIDLGIFQTGRVDSWTEYALGALETYGPFRLAYLETLVRMADWRASADLPVLGSER